MSGKKINRHERVNPTAGIPLYLRVEANRTRSVKPMIFFVSFNHAPFENTIFIATIVIANKAML